MFALVKRFLIDMERKFESLSRQKALFPNWRNFNGFRYFFLEKHGTKKLFRSNDFFA